MTGDRFGHIGCQGRSVKGQCALRNVMVQRPSPGKKGINTPRVGQTVSFLNLRTKTAFFKLIDNLYFPVIVSAVPIMNNVLVDFVVKNGR